MKIILEKNKKVWYSKFRGALRVDRITEKRATSKSPFELMYDTSARMPLNNLLCIYKFNREEELEIPQSMGDIIEQLVKLDEIRNEAQKKNTKLQHVKYLFDKRTSNRKFKSSDMILKWNVRAHEK